MNRLLSSLMLTVVTSFAAAACSSGTPADGTERGACYANGTCNSGLSCLSNVCVAVPADGGVDVTPGGDSGADVAPGTDAAVDSAPGMDVVAPTDVVTAMDVQTATDTGPTDAFVEGGIACPGAAIFHPGADCRVVGTSVPFVGHARTATCVPITGSALVWTDNLEGNIGTGEMFNHTFTMLGNHTVTLTVTDPGGGTYTARVSFPIQAPCL